MLSRPQGSEGGVEESPWQGCVLDSKTQKSFMDPE